MSTWCEKLNNLSEIKNQLPEFLKTLEADFVNEDDSDDSELRSLEQAQIIFEMLSQMASLLSPMFDDHPTLLSLYNKNFGPFEDLFDEEMVADICFLDDYIYPSTQSFGYSVDGSFSTEFVHSHIDFIKGWQESTLTAHEKTQKLLNENFSLTLNMKNLDCTCVGCVADFRTKTREQIYKVQIELIDDQVDKLEDKVLHQKIDQISDHVFQLRKRIDKNYSLVKSKLRKGSLNKLDAEVKSYFKDKFDSNSELGRVYKEKIKAFCNSILVEEEIKVDFVNEEEFERFFSQLHTNLWKPARFIKREFKKVVSSIMTFKRKDISATILRDYLGQFWIHSQARRMKRKIIYHMGPTNSGKTYHSIEALCAADRGCYLAPLRLLASELYDTMNSKGVKTTLLTGEEIVEVEGASHYSSTIEMALLNQEFDCCVIDEIQMITDPQRGWAWTRALVNLQSPEIHLCGDPSVLALIKKILALTGDELEVREYTRMTELNIQNAPITLSRLEKNDAVIVFSRKNALKYKSDLERLGFKVSIVYGRLSPEVRREQARKFDSGETDIMVSTDAIAMGMNLPVKRIVFTTLSKFFDGQEHQLSASEIKQIAGRAGRYKRFPVGLVNCLEKVEDGTVTLQAAINSELEQKEQGMVGPDLDIYSRVNDALKENNLTELSLVEFLRLFNTMTFEKPFYCVELKEMIDVSEMVEDLDRDNTLSAAEKFGFSCAPVNLGLMDHVEYFNHIVSQFVAEKDILCVNIDVDSDNIDYLETVIKCVELYQWLARHFNNKHFVFDEAEILNNKGQAIEKLNSLLSERLHKHCSSCGVKMSPDFRFNICEKCFDDRRFTRKKRSFRSQGKGSGSGGSKRRSGSKSGGGSSSGSGGKSKRPSSSHSKFNKKSKKKKSSSYVGFSKK